MAILTNQNNEEFRYLNRGEYCYYCYLKELKKKNEEGIYLTPEDKDSLKMKLHDNNKSEKVFVIKSTTVVKMDNPCICRSCINDLSERINKINGIEPEVKAIAEPEVNESKDKKSKTKGDK